MARQLPFYAEYNFRFEYKPDKLNVFAVGLSRQSDYELTHVSRVTTDLYGRKRLGYQADENYTLLVWFLPSAKNPRSIGSRLDNGHSSIVISWPTEPGDPLQVAVPNDEDLKYDTLLEAHDAPVNGQVGGEKTYQAVSQTFRRPPMCKREAHYVKKCETCQMVIHFGHAWDPLLCLPSANGILKSMSFDFVFGLPADDTATPSVYLVPVRDKAIGKQATKLFLGCVFRYHDLLETIVFG
ncbi:Hypothetical protein PHPALM_19716 [Phytophthora palmivora]|uniref:Integrase zinc-binding domain-containing protein n=1 Tax=Phytophthora palmivora TaxID=4796 RepID=A0A2P4XGP5_9STRA|nr:Hypothetical protein PHPALM_19716 [Phytophthora palmivora]